MNFDLERPKAAREPLVVVTAAVGEDGVADIDHHETVDADTSDPAAEHGDQSDPVERVDTAVAGAAVDDGVAVGAVAVDAAELSSLERAGLMHLQEKIHLYFNV